MITICLNCLVILDSTMREYNLRKERDEDIKLYYFIYIIYIIYKYGKQTTKSRKYTTFK